jgi:chemotaxis protein methyltransferase CheR
VTSVLGIERFRNLVARRFGLWFEDGRLGHLSEVLGARLEATGEDLGSYLDRLDGGRSGAAELRALARALTIGETYFFRHVEQLRAFEEVALPGRLAARAPGERVNIISVACASGEEPYSLAILVRQRLAAPAVTILGVDINAEVLEKAQRGRYSSWSLRDTPRELEERWFRPDGRELVLDAQIRAAVRFEEHNLAEPRPMLWLPEHYDVIFCRNFLMYFTLEAARALVARMTSALVPGGYLFLGHAETLRGLSRDFHLCHSHGAFYYQRGPASGAELSRPPPPPPQAPSAPEPVDASWFESIGRAAERIHALADGARRPDAPAAAAGPSQVAAAMALLQRERYADALDALAELPADASRTLEVRLLRAVLLAQSGRLEPAEAVCREILAGDELHAGAHYLLALCREAAGDGTTAVEHHQRAAYLDPSFAMPHLHLGLLARRGDDRPTALRELRQALVLLECEEAGRLLLFGGGFTREGLVALCRAELQRGGDAP